MLMLSSQTLTSLSQGLRNGVWPEVNQEIACHLETEPAGRHAGGDLEEVGNNALVETFDSLLGNNHLDGVGDALVLVTHA